VGDFTVTWIIWILLLITQNFAFTMVSQARNSKSILYHAIASLFSNGIWFASQFMLIDLMIKIIEAESWYLLTVGGLVYILATMTGSLTSHWVLMKWIEPRVEKKSKGPGWRLQP